MYINVSVFFRSLNIDCDSNNAENRFISQKQYKRKIRRESQDKYSTLDPKLERKLGKIFKF